MSTRRLLNVTTGVVALLLVVAAVLSWTGGASVDAVGLELAGDQGAILGDLQRDARDLATATDLTDVNAARGRLGASILRFDRVLSALINGGTVARPDGTSVRVEPTEDRAVRAALTQAVDTWRRIGVPLADLAAGAFSAYSAAGQAALRGLEEGQPGLARQLDDVHAALLAADDGHSGRVTWARGLAVGLALLLAGLFVLRRFVTAPGTAPAPRAQDPAATPIAPAAAPVPPAAAQPRARPMAAQSPAPAPSLPAQPYTSPVDLEDVSLAVDRLAVDLDAMATNSDKMRTAIDSVGQVLQGMLFSLKEMATDTAEGDRLVAGAHSAATYTRDVAEALNESVREMSKVVANVSGLARRTRQVADQIATDTVHGERTGVGFTRAVSNEVRGLALHTGAAAADIEETVSTMLAGTREYEEAIAEILQHISAINKVSQELGQVMLDPPAPAVVPAPTAAPVAEVDPFATAETAADLGALSDADLGEVTAAAIADAADALDGAPDAEEPAAEAPAEPVAAEEPAASEDPAADAAPAAEPFSLDPAGGESASAPAAEERPKVFMLSKTAPAADDDAAAAATEPGPAPVAEPAAAPAPEAAADAPAVTVAEAADGVLTSADPGELEAALEDLSEPGSPAEPAPAAPAAAAPEPAAEPEPAADAGGDEPAVADGESPNIFILNAPQAQPAAETVPPDDGS